MQILYLLRSIAHFSYHVSIIQSLSSNGHNILLLFDKNWSKGDSKLVLENFLNQNKDISAGFFPYREDFWRGILFTSRELLSFSSYLNRNDQSKYYLHRWQKYIPIYLRVPTYFRPIRYLVASDEFQILLRSIEEKVPPDKNIINWLEKNKPDVVVASPVNMRFSEEVEYIKAANFIGIPSVVPVLSWDNLTTKGLFHVVPKLTLVWNYIHYDEACRIHKLPPNQIVIVGSPFFDKWFDINKYKSTREEFCKKVGLDARKPFILYLGSSINIAKDETWLLRDLRSKLNVHPDSRIQELNILVRPHPGNAQVFEQLNDSQIRVWPKGGALPDSEDSMKDFYNSLYHCTTSLGINTTGMIDAILVDKPCITIMTEKYKETQKQALHFQYLLNADVLEISYNLEECINYIGRLLSGEDSKKEVRKIFIKNFARPRGLNISAGKVAACCIELLAQGMDAQQIDRIINHIILEDQKSRLCVTAQA